MEIRCDSVTVRPAIVAEADRVCVPVFRATLKLTVPFPVPAAPDAMLIQDDPSEAVQLQPAVDVTEKLTLPPELAIDCDVGVTEYVQGAPAWLTVPDRPAIVSVLCRVAVVGLAATVKETMPAPVPLGPPVIVIQLAPLDAVHAQPVGVVTENELEPPDDPIERLVGDTVYAHVTGNVKPFDGLLADDPPGPTAAMRTSYVTPPAGSGLRIVLRPIRIVPAPSGVGFPRPVTRIGVDEPRTYSWKSYRCTSAAPLPSAAW